MFGLPDETIKLFCDYFASRPEIEEVILFGSRAMGTHSPGSDIDLAILTSSADDLSGSVKTDLDGLPTPYLFDVVDYRHVTNSDLRSHIDRVGKVLFRKTNS